MELTRSEKEIFMPRKPRFILPGVPQHVIQRGHNREPCFYAPEDYQYYLQALKVAVDANGAKLHAYVLMTNHVHLLATPMTEHAIPHCMQDLGRKYVKYMNAAYQRTGTLWEGRYKASLVDTDAYLLSCMRYIELNPVRAGMVVHPGDYPWSSFSYNAHGKSNTLIEAHPLYQSLGATPERCQNTYRDLFRADLSADQLHLIRAALNQELVLGRDDFKDKITQMTQRQSRRGKDGRPRVAESAGEYYVF
jgi:putative transposase